MIKSKILFLFFTLSIYYSYSQNMNSIWCFGDSAGIDFRNLSSPVPIASGMDGRGTCASMSDSSGNLLFYSYTRGNPSLIATFIMNKNHQIMDNGDSIIGQGWYEENVITPMPNHPGMYYLFSTGVVGFSKVGLYYSIVDMNQNGGLGKVTI